MLNNNLELAINNPATLDKNANTGQLRCFYAMENKAFLPLERQSILMEVKRV
jgi:hypothetical protein